MFSSLSRTIARAIGPIPVKTQRASGNASGYIVSTRRHVTMKTRVVRIGNSRGIRIPKRFLEKTGLPEEVDISIEGDSLVIRPVKKPRSGWTMAFQEMARRGDDAVLDQVGQTLSIWDETEWEWY
jgi:antitoxin MazE